MNINIIKFHSWSLKVLRLKPQFLNQLGVIKVFDKEPTKNLQILEKFQQQY